MFIEPITCVNNHHLTTEKTNLSIAVDPPPPALDYEIKRVVKRMTAKSNEEKETKNIEVEEGGHRY